ncbi:glycoside hydrolase family 16 protein [Mycolicibacterium sp. XJ1819]
MVDHVAGKRSRRISGWTLLRAAVAVAMSISLLMMSGCTRVSHAEHAGPSCPPAAPRADEFNGPAGAPPDPAMWSYQLTGGKLQVYTDSPRNASLDGNGNLAINVLRETIVVPPYPPFEYTSARVHTLGKFELCYGDLRARIRVPGATGLLPSFWLLGTDLPAVGWPRSGEIDIIDVAGYLAGSGLHAPGIDKADKAPFDVLNDWHEFWMRWEPDKIVTGVDGTEIATYTPDSVGPFGRWMFNNHPMFVILNVGVGGQAGPPDQTTQFPATMLVDWIRYTPL